MWPTRTSEPLSACHTKPFWDAMTRSEISRIIEVLHHCFVNTSRTASALWAGVLEALAGTVLEGTVSGHGAPRIRKYKGRITNNILSDKIPHTWRLRTLFSVSSLSLPRQRAAWQVYHWNSQKTIHKTYYTSYFVTKNMNEYPHHCHKTTWNLIRLGGTWGTTECMEGGAKRGTQKKAPNDGICFWLWFIISQHSPLRLSLSLSHSFNQWGRNSSKVIPYSEMSRHRHGWGRIQYFLVLV